MAWLFNRPGQTTTSVQPDSRSTVLNRGTGDNVLQIYGAIDANGKVYLVNPNGVVIGKTGDALPIQVPVTRSFRYKTKLHRESERKSSQDSCFYFAGFLCCIKTNSQR
ncbi:MAG: filamentous hemagglutinin N-terminal domain-containing protein [Candidatus Methylacidiphilales bacterium]